MSTISPEQIAEKLGHMETMLEAAENAYNALVGVTEMKSGLLEMAKGLAPKEDYDEMVATNTAMKIKMEYARKRLDVMQATFQHVKAGYEEMIREVPDTNGVL